MAQIKIKYKDISITSSKRAGNNGFTFRHKTLGGLIHLYLNDTKLLNTIDKALQKEYGESNGK